MGKTTGKTAPNSAGTQITNLSDLKQIQIPQQSNSQPDRVLRIRGFEFGAANLFEVGRRRESVAGLK
jgi:hypothetical protein